MCLKMLERCEVDELEQRLLELCSNVEDLYNRQSPRYHIIAAAG